MEQQTCSKLGKEYVKAVYCHPAYLTYVQSILCEMPGWMNESKFTHSFIHSFIPGIKIARRSTNDLRYADDTTLMAKSERN